MMYVSVVVLHTDTHTLHSKHCILLLSCMHAHTHTHTNGTQCSYTLHVLTDCSWLTYTNHCSIMLTSLRIYIYIALFRSGPFSSFYVIYDIGSGLGTHGVKIQELSWRDRAWFGKAVIKYSLEKLKN